MIETQAHFEKRLTRLGRKHRAMERGYVTRMGHDGLIVAKPVGTRMQFPLRGALLIILAFFAFKGFLLANLGPATYQARLDQLYSGTLIEQGGGWLMQLEPASRMVANFLGPVLR